jgi:hypothetical protein
MMLLVVLEAPFIPKWEKNLCEGGFVDIPSLGYISLSLLFARLNPLESILMYRIAFWVSLHLSIGLSFAQFETELSPETTKAFDQYLNGIELEWKNAVKRPTIPLWMQSLDRRTRVRSGEIIVEEVEDVPDIPDGMVHYWTGEMFISGVTGQSLVDLLVDYDKHKEIYPEAIDSRLLGRSGNVVKGFLRLKKQQVLTVILNTEHAAEISHFDSSRWFIASRSTRVAEVANPDTPQEEELPLGTGRGFLWRLNAYWAIEQVEGGVMVSLRTISLSRSIPWVLRPVIGPFVESIPREAIFGTLDATRLALIR